MSLPLPWRQPRAGLGAAKALARQRLVGPAARALPSALLANHPSILRYRLFDRPIWVPPHDINAKPGAGEDWMSVRRTEAALLAEMRCHFVVGGDWDVETRPFGLHPAVDELLVQGLAPEETAAHARMVSALRVGDMVRSRGYRSRAEIDAYFHRILALADAMEREGFKTQHELGRPPTDGTTICIGRWGQVLLLRNGNHRSSVAKVLGVAAIPAYVVGVHPGWVDERRRHHGEPNPVRAVEKGLRELDVGRPSQAARP